MRQFNSLFIPINLLFCSLKVVTILLLAKLTVKSFLIFFIGKNAQSRLHNMHPSFLVTALLRPAAAYLICQASTKNISAILLQLLNLSN